MSDTPPETNSESTTDAPTADDGGVGRLQRRNFLKSLAATGAFAGTSSEALTGEVSAATTESGWSPKPPQLETPWTSEVGPDKIGRAHV